MNKLGNQFISLLNCGTSCAPYVVTKKMMNYKLIEMHFYVKQGS